MLTVPAACTSSWAVTGASTCGQAEQCGRMAAAGCQGESAGARDLAACAWHRAQRSQFGRRAARSIDALVVALACGALGWSSWGRGKASTSERQPADLRYEAHAMATAHHIRPPLTIAKTALCSASPGCVSLTVCAILCLTPCILSTSAAGLSPTDCSMTSNELAPFLRKPAFPNCCRTCFRVHLAILQLIFGAALTKRRRACRAFSTARRWRQGDACDPAQHSLRSASSPTEPTRGERPELTLT